MNKVELADVSGLPETLKAALVEDGGKNYLDLTQLAPASELEAFKAKYLTASQEAIERRKGLKAWEALGETPDAVREKLGKGADPEIVKQLQTQLETTKAESAARIATILRERAVADFKAELAKNGVVPEGLDLLGKFGADRITHDDDGNLRILSDDGKTPMVGKGANGGATLADLAATIAKSYPRLVADDGKGGGGKPPGSNGGTPGKTMKRAEFLALHPTKQAALIKDGVTPID